MCFIAVLATSICSWNSAYFLPLISVYTAMSPNNQALKTANEIRMSVQLAISDTVLGPISLPPKNKMAWYN